MQTAHCKGLATRDQTYISDINKRSSLPGSPLSRRGWSLDMRAILLERTDWRSCFNVHQHQIKGNINVQPLLQSLLHLLYILFSQIRTDSVVTNISCMYSTLFIVELYPTQLPPTLLCSNEQILKCESDPCRKIQLGLTSYKPHPELVKLVFTSW